MPLTYRDAVPSDLPFIVGLVVEDSVIPTGDDPADSMAPDYVAALAALTGDPNNRMIVAELDGSPIGTLQMTFIPGLMRRGMWRLLLEQVHIAASHRSRGFGGEMIRWAIAEGRARNCGMVQLTSNKKRLDAHRFYERLGFLKSHEGFKYYL
ncbi:MAG TPA: GNAT family N-acetyltransferase [Devosia sp.]|nr:GNAT family N-acetyltransferase [Devosia sp.]